MCVCVLPSRVKPKTAKQPDVQSLEFSPTLPTLRSTPCIAAHTHTHTYTTLFSPPFFCSISPFAFSLSLSTTCRNTFGVSLYLSASTWALDMLPPSYQKCHLLPRYPLVQRGNLRKTDREIDGKARQPCNPEICLCACAG